MPSNFDHAEAAVFQLARHLGQDEPDWRNFRPVQRAVTPQAWTHMVKSQAIQPFEARTGLALDPTDDTLAPFRTQPLIDLVVFLADQADAVATGAVFESPQVIMRLRADAVRSAQRTLVADVIVALAGPQNGAGAAMGIPAADGDWPDADASIEKHFERGPDLVALHVDADAAPPVRYLKNLGLYIGTASATAIERLAARDDVTVVAAAPELSMVRPVQMAMAPDQVDSHWALEQLGVFALRDMGLTGRGVLVGHLDTGADSTHPALNGAIRHFAEFDHQANRTGRTEAFDSESHGTHTAGTIVGRTIVNGNAFGVAPDAELAVALSIEGGRVIDRILVGLDWIAGQPGVRVLSMSVGLRGFTDAFQIVVDRLRMRGILPVIAVGNEGAGTSRSPGNYVDVLSVGASDVAHRVADFSSSQTFQRPGDPLVPDCVAPGVGIVSCIPGGGFASFQGTSMATPHIAGLAALLLEAKPHATVQELEQAILGSCRLVGGLTGPRANRGLPDGVRALQLLP
jgi:subtilisin